MNKEYFLTLFFLASLQQFAYSQNMNTYLMESTFRIHGISLASPDKITMGTVFIMGRPFKNTSSQARYVLITAAHVLEGMRGDEAVLNLRYKDDSSNFKLSPFKFPIRENGVPIWKKHPSADVAVMYISLPTNIFISVYKTSMLASDSIINHIGITPGDDLLCLGFPFGYSANTEGFPILRSGKLSSYPIIPSKKHPSMLFDFQVFEGNSGGPVYFISLQRVKESTVDNRGFQSIIGLVSKQLSTPSGQFLELAEVVPSSFILETLNQLPDP